VLTVRWSNDDPNPVAIVKQKREFRDRFTEVSRYCSLVHMWISTLVVRWHWWTRGHRRI
jgi:hypothetical protein